MLMRNIRKVFLPTLAVAALALGIAGQASAAAMFLICGYQADDGTLWETRYVYPATRDCPATSVKNGKEGVLVYEEVLAW
jgi:hypothetical protein